MDIYKEPLTLTTLRTNNECCLVVGAGGFIGSNLVSQLRLTYKKIYACDVFFHKETRLQFQKNNIHHIEGGVKGFSLNLTNYQDIEKIFYFAGSATPALLEAELNKGYFSDQQNLLTVLESCKELPKLKEFIYASSGGTVYGLSDCPHKESFETAPISAYGLSKLIQEQYISFYAQRIGFKEKLARISNPYGKSATHNNKTLQGFIDVTVNKITSNQEINIWGDGRIIRDFLHIEDLITGIIAISEENVPAGIYNIGSGDGHSLNQIINYLRELGASPKVSYLPARGIDIPISILDIDKIKNTTSWVPKLHLKAGIEKMLNNMTKVH